MGRLMLVWPQADKRKQRWFVNGGVFLIVVAGALLYYLSTTSPRLPHKFLPLLQGGYNSTYGPLLGEEADTNKYYYPPKNVSHLPVASYNKPPNKRPRTPLFIGFTQNNPIIMQCVVSYIAAGWPPEDIIVVDNSGTLDANPRRQLSESNPFFLDYDRLRGIGVSILQTPVLLTFAQLQNFYLRTAIGHDWHSYFWSHMDVLAIGNEHIAPYKPFYHGIIEVVEDTLTRPDDWALRWFAYDQLTMMSVNAWRKIGQWDTFIPYYHSDCDAYSRAGLHGLLGKGTNVVVGGIFDIADLLDDYDKRLFPALGEEGVNSTRYTEVRAAMKQMEVDKRQNAGKRRPWQDNLSGGVGEPFSYDPKAFRYAWMQISSKGEELYKMKWGRDECHLDTNHGSLSKAWRNLPS